MTEYELKEVVDLITRSFVDLKERISAVDDKISSVKKTVDVDHDALLLTRSKMEQQEKDLKECWDELRNKGMQIDKLRERVWQISTTVSIITTIAGLVWSMFK
jgi:predicted  nucleic acid-binding Zn-ribbon protein